MKKYLLLGAGLLVLLAAYLIGRDYYSVNYTPTSVVTLKKEGGQAGVVLSPSNCDTGTVAFQYFGNTIQVVSKGLTKEGACSLQLADSYSLTPKPSSDYIVNAECEFPASLADRTYLFTQETDSNPLFDPQFCRRISL